MLHGIHLNLVNHNEGEDEQRLSDFLAQYDIPHHSGPWQRRKSPK
jgi:hypothetical protein